MSIHHQTIITCDQNPLPDRCKERLLIDLGLAIVDTDTERDLIHRLCLKKDWGIIDVNGRSAHYCPYHRPVR